MSLLHKIPEPRAKRGRPRRARYKAKVSTVRVDEDTFNILQKTFGSLGNALYYIAGGIRDFRLKHAPVAGDTARPHDLTFDELSTLRDLLLKHLDSLKLGMQGYQVVYPKDYSRFLEIDRKLRWVLYEFGASSALPSNQKIP